MFYFIRKHTVIDKPAAADCFFYLHTLFCIWIDSYFYCPVYFPHLIPTYKQTNSIIVFRAICSSFIIIQFHCKNKRFLFYLQKSFGYLWDLWVIYEHLCSNLQFISLPEEVGEFLLYIMLKKSKPEVSTLLLTSGFIINHNLW